MKMRNEIAEQINKKSKSHSMTENAAIATTKGTAIQMLVNINNRFSCFPIRLISRFNQPIC